MVFPLFCFLVMALPCSLLSSATKSTPKKPYFMDADFLSPFHDSREVNTRRKNRLSHQFYEVIVPSSATSKTPSHEVAYFRKKIKGRDIFGHKITITDSRQMLSVLEPLEEKGCVKQKLATVLESSAQRHCFVAVSAGFFNERTGQCYGNLVSDGEEMQKFHGLKSANFGVRKDGSIVIGYLKESDILDMRTPFQQLVSGVGWILRDGEKYLEQSVKYEQCNLDNLEQFFNARSARTMIGTDATGKVYIVQVEGRTGIEGIDLNEAADLLLSFGLVNAINLNGAGASTLAINGSVVNYPSNVCTQSESDRPHLCSMKVSSILCVHPPDQCIDGQYCAPNGHCFKGRCRCKKGWKGENCHIIDDDHLTVCCWRNYYLVIVLSALIAASVIGNIVLCDLYLLYRFRAKDLSQPSRKQKDKLRMYLKRTSILLSSNDDVSSEQSVPN